MLFVLFIYYGHYQKAGPLPPIIEFFNPYHGWWQQAEREKLPERFFRGNVTGEVTVAFDDRLVPHIYADTYEDAVYAQGILHAHFRLWQMDMTSRASVGQLSEILGERTLEYDRTRRRLGLMEAARLAEQNFDGQDRTSTIVDQYVEGVNHYIKQMDQADFPLEFKLLDYEPTDWSSLRTAMVVTAMTYDLCFKHEDIESSTTLTQLGLGAFENYFPQWNPRQVPIIQEDASNASYQKVQKPMLSQIELQSPFDQPDPDNGSNNWAIHKSKTATKRNILANDPHLRLRLPSVWYEMHIHLPEKDIYGVSFPGIPGIVLGFNDAYAWGSTNVGHDVADWFHPVWQDSSLTAYQLNGTWKNPEELVEVIAVRGQENDTVISLQTELGRVPYTTSGHELKGAVFQWGPALPLSGSSMHTFIGFNLGNNYEDFRAALVHHKFPAQNFVFADREENVAIHVQGALPIRNIGDGRFIMDSMEQMSWSSYIPQEDLPFEHNPDKGFVSSANQHSTYPSYPYPYHGSFEDFRGRTLNRLLSEQNPASSASVKEMQQSAYSLKAAEALPLLMGMLDSATFVKYAADLDGLQTWDFNYYTNLSSPALFELWWATFKELTMDEWGDDWLPIEDFRMIQLLEESPNDTIFDWLETETFRETAKDIVHLSWKASIEKYDSLGRPDWMAQKGTYIEHMAMIDAFSTDVLAVPGNGDALNATKEHHGPSWRMVVELGDKIDAWGIYPGGQSGNPGSYFYDNQVEDWAQGKYYPLHLFDRPDQKEFTTKWTIKTKP